MQSHIRPRKRKGKKSNWETQWKKISKRLSGLYQYRPTGMYYARVRSSGKVYWESLKTKDLAFAKRKLKTFKERLEHTHPTLGKVTLLRWLEEIYFRTLRGRESTLADKRRIIERIKKTWLLGTRAPMRDLKPTDVERWLNEQFGNWSTSYYNSALSLVRDAFQKAVTDRIIFDNPAASLKYRKRTKPIRLTPTYEQFKAIIADARAQVYNADAQDSADFLEACGLLGLGQAELAGMKREHIDLESGRIIAYRFKTDTGFVIPIYPQARALIERLCEGKKSSTHIFPLQQARKALRNSCKRLGYPQFTHRSLRRMFITRAIERGVDVKVIAEWQGHRDGGELILRTYSHVRPEHSQRMATLMTDEQPANVIPLTKSQAAKRLGLPKAN
jgi:integrase